MRKIASMMKVVVLLLLIFSLPSYGQSQTVSGTILDADKKIPLAGVTVKVTGTTTTTQTNEKGVFTIKVAKGQTLTVSSIGFETKTVPVSSGQLSISLKSTVAELDEVVVAMDLKRKPRELGYSVQKVTGKEISETQRENFVTSLEGRVAGVTVTPTSGTAGASAGIVLRGFNTISGNNQPLFILDGIIVDNSTFNENSQGGTGIGLASDLPNRNNDYTNRIADLNPNDIESVTVLKGPEATALYGSQAASGAIVITTKKAKATGGKILLSYDDNFRVQRLTRFVKTDDDYSPGSNGVPIVPPSSGQTAFTAFGPAYGADVRKYDNIHDFFKTGFTQTHTLGMEWGTQNVGFRFSGQYLNSDGVVPNNTYTKYNFKLTNNTKIGKYIDINPSIAYSSADNIKPIKGVSGYLLDLYAWPVTNDIRNYQDPKGNKNLLYTTAYNSEYDNPIWSAMNNKTGDHTNRVVATLGININPFPWLTVSGRFGYDTYKTNGYLFTHPESYLLTSATGGTLDNYYRTYKGYNHTISATAHKNFGNFSTRLLVGTMWQDYETDEFGVTGTHLIDSSRTDSSNTLASTRSRLLRNVAGLPNVSILREMAYFGEASVGYKNVIFLSYSHRFEEASPIPAQNRNYHYPGASLSMILSDIFPSIKNGNILNYLKLRGSIANTAHLNDPYSNQSVFVNNLFSSVVPSFSYGFTNSNPFLTPESQSTYEVGTEIRMFNSRLTLEAAYYNTLCTNQIAQGYRASYATGFVLNTGNAASLRNQGVEITMDVTPIKHKDFEWNVRFNFNHMWSKVLDLPASIGLNNDYYNSDTYLAGNVRGGLVRGHSTGTITGFGYQRSNSGDILINPANGLPLIEAINYVRGDRTPAFTLGTLNTLRYKNWSLNFLWDLKVGGDIYNGTDYYLTAIGRSARTANRTTPLIVRGVLNDGLQNTSTPTKNTIVINPYYNNAYYTTMAQSDEEFIQHNVNWLRLRDLTLNYMLPEKLTRKIRGLRSGSLFFTANDLILITNYTGADPAVNANNPGTNGVGAYGFDYGSTPTPMSLSIGIRAAF